MSARVVFADLEKPLELTARDVEFVRTRFSVSTEADLFVRVCPTCAHPVWSQTALIGTGRTVATLGECCERCAAFEQRFPDVFHFVTTFHAASRFIQARLKRSENASTERQQ